MTSETVVSLTPAGQVLGERIAVTAGCEHLHRPEPFAETVQSRFRAGHRLVMITATGIAVRVLAPVIMDKHSDPAVLVLDENGYFVVPLLSGHEGGGNEWGRKIAAAIGAECVITSAESYVRPVLVAGIGCERGCPETALRHILDETLRGYGLDSGDISALASIDMKQDESGLLALAGRLGVGVEFYSAHALLRYTDRLSERSSIVFRATGCYGVAEAAALAHAEFVAGTPAELVVEKRKSARATCAIARAFRECHLT